MNIRPIGKSKHGQYIMVNLLILVMSIMVMVALLPMLKSVLEVAQQSDSLNCAGFSYNGDPANALSYNSSLGTNTIACIGISLYLPYIVLVVLIGGVTKLLYGRVTSGGQEQPF